MGKGMKVAVVGTGGDPSHAPARKSDEKAGYKPLCGGYAPHESLSFVVLCTIVLIVQVMYNTVVRF